MKLKELVNKVYPNGLKGDCTLVVTADNDTYMDFLDEILETAGDREVINYKLLDSELVKVELK